jgi:hypothetical protein
MGHTTNGRAGRRYSEGVGGERGKGSARSKCGRVLWREREKGRRKGKLGIKGGNVMVEEREGVIGLNRLVGDLYSRGDPSG